MDQAFLTALPSHQDDDLADRSQLQARVLSFGLQPVSPGRVIPADSCLDPSASTVILEASRVLT